jgi:hypothetical protein
LVASKRFHKTDLKLTLGHETQTAEYGKVDPDTGLQFNLGPGRIRYMAVTLRHSFQYGALQATITGPGMWVLWPRPATRLPKWLEYAYLRTRA